MVKLKVTATQIGFFDGQVKSVGEEFVLPSEEAFSEVWMSKGEEGEASPKSTKPTLTLPQKAAKKDEEEGA